VAWRFALAPSIFALAPLLSQKTRSQFAVIFEWSHLVRRCEKKSLAPLPVSRTIEDNGRRTSYHLYSRIPAGRQRKIALDLKVPVVADCGGDTVARYIQLTSLGLGLLFLFPALADAGMGSALTDVDVGEAYAQYWSATGLQDFVIARLQNISFFLLGLLLATLAAKFLWNWVRKDWTFLPRLTYVRALGVVFLWGLLFVLVLSMVSGARELMTPGAWVRQGWTYRLANDAVTPTDTRSIENEREKQLAQLRAALWRYADEHQGKFPDDLTTAAIPAEVTQVPDPSRMSYVYVKGLAKGAGKTPLAYEPEIFGSRRCVLFANGDIQMLNAQEFRLQVAGEKP
jgi:hypothetical protein